MSEPQIIDSSTGDCDCTGEYFDTNVEYLNSYNYFIDSRLSYSYNDIASQCSANRSYGWSVENLIYHH